MLLKFSDNIFKRTFGVAFYNLPGIIAFTIIAIFAEVQHALGGIFGWGGLDFPTTPVTIMGSALAIFLGFRNNSAYDRWWEARKIWGGIVNTSRSMGSFVMTFPSPRHGEASIDEISAWRKSVINRQIGWLYILKAHLRKQTKWEVLKDFISEKEYEELMHKGNKPSQLLHNQSQAIASAFEKGMIDNFRHMELAREIRTLYELQGKCERIKNTVFPYYYNYFTHLFVWLFIICLPFALVPIMDYMAVPMSVAISFIFYILNKAGELTEDPFEGRAADTPMSTISRSIEIDLLEMLGEEHPPKPLEVQKTVFDAHYLD